jgi:hypothetical protein
VLDQAQRDFCMTLRKRLPGAEKISMIPVHSNWLTGNMAAPKNPCWRIMDSSF